MARRAGVWLVLWVAVASAGCQDEVAGEGAVDYRVRDVQPALGDAQRDDAARLPLDQTVAALDGGSDQRFDGRVDGRDSASGDAAHVDAVIVDSAVVDDMAIAVDRAVPVDLAPPPPDMGPDLPPGREPCQQGPGWSLLRISYDAFSTSLRDDLWDVPCDYSIRINDACGVFDRCRGGVGCDVGRTNTGAVELDGSDDLLIWFDTPPEDVQAAVFYVLGRSLCAASSTEFDLASPTDGWAVSGGPVGQQFEYQWHFAALPAFAGDDLALILTAGRGCGRLGVQAFEICVP